MSARLRESNMVEDHQITKLTASVEHLHSDVTHNKAEVQSLRSAIEALTTHFLSFKTEVTKELGSFRAEVAKDLGSFKAEVAKDLGSFKAEVAKEMGSFKAEVAREFGSIRTSIERTKLWMILTGAGAILSVWGAALALARFLKP